MTARILLARQRRGALVRFRRRLLEIAGRWTCVCGGLVKVLGSTRNGVRLCVRRLPVRPAGSGPGLASAIEAARLPRGPGPPGAREIWRATDP